MTITTQQLLGFLNKANQLEISYTIEEVDEVGYDIRMFYNWNTDYPKNFYYQYVFLPNEGYSGFDGDLNYYTFEKANQILDVRLEEKRVKEEKERKRQELLDRLTPEERELLGV